MEDLTTNITDGIGAAEAVAGGAIAWLTTKFEWWKSIESKPMKVGIAVGAFLAVGITLSIITAPFT